MNVTLRNEEVLSVLNQAAPMLRRMAFRSGQDYDDLSQTAALVALEHYEKAQGAENPRAYLYGIMRRVPWQMSRPADSISLDRPVDAESATTYADLLPTPVPVEIDEKREERRTRALFAALRRLPLEAQQYLCRVHNLAAYQPVRPRRGRFAGSGAHLAPRSDHALGTASYRWLRENEALARVICPPDRSIPPVNLGEEESDGKEVETRHF